MSLVQQTRLPRSLAEFLATQVTPVIDVIATTDEPYCPICREAWDDAPCCTSQYTMGTQPGSAPEEVFTMAFSFKALRIRHPCSHVFHAYCFVQHAKEDTNQQTCPMCRMPLYGPAENTVLGSPILTPLEDVPSPQQDERTPQASPTESEDVNMDDVKNELDLLQLRVTNLKESFRELSQLVPDDPEWEEYSGAASRSRENLLWKIENLLETTFRSILDMPREEFQPFMGMSTGLRDGALTLREEVSALEAEARSLGRAPENGDEVEQDSAHVAHDEHEVLVQPEAQYYIPAAYYEDL